MPSDTTLIALAGIAATGLVGVLSPVVQAAVAVASKRGDYRTSREDELRQVVETAAVRLTEAILQLDEARDALPDSSPNPHMGSLDVHLAQLYANEDRLGIRLGPEAPECRCYHEAVLAWQSAYQGLSAASAGLGVDSADIKQIREKRTASYAAGESFKSAASARLSPDANRKSRRAARKANRPGDASHGRDQRVASDQGGTA